MIKKRAQLFRFLLLNILTISVRNYITAIFKREEFKFPILTYSYEKVRQYLVKFL